MRRVVVTGTGTGVGKTVAAAALVAKLGAAYWKPIQSGLEEETDSQAIARLVPGAEILPEAYRLTTPCSPHLAAEIDGVEIDREQLMLPERTSLVVEGAGGALVPVTRELLFADLFKQWNLPVIIVASTGLGTISHSLMTIEALENRGNRICGILYMGPSVHDSEAIIAEIGQVPVLGRIPHLDPLTPQALAAVELDLDAGNWA